MYNMDQACSDSEITARWQDARTGRKSKLTARSSRRRSGMKYREQRAALCSDKRLLEPVSRVPEYCSSIRNTLNVISDLNTLRETSFQLC